ncbi:MAG: hypothetical protein CR986_05060 [Ignavibacteriae bacterium]|nr:MAG: hypothetical protein CR986_05060 [Ignavibacteriota bacterium]
MHNKSKILILTFGGINDSLNITPMLQALYEQTQPEITILTFEKNMKSFHNNPHINNIFYIQNGFLNKIKIILKLNKLNFNIIIDANEFFTKTLSRLLILINSEYKIGFEKDNSKTSLTHIVESPNKNKVHVIDRILLLLNYFNFEVVKTNLNVNYFPTQNSIDHISNYFIKHNVNHDFRVLINVTAKEGIGSWGKTSYIQLLKYLKNYDVKIIITGSLDDLQIIETLADNNHLIFYNDDLLEYSALVQNSNFIFTPESYTIQLASSKKIPVYCLFVKKSSNEMLDVPYNSDFDFAVTDKGKLDNISYGKVLNNFVPYFEYVYERYKPKE